MHSASGRDDEIGSAQHEDARQLGDEKLRADEQPDAPEGRVHGHQLVAGQDVVPPSHEVRIEQRMIRLYAAVAGANLAGVVDEQMSDVESVRQRAALEATGAHPHAAGARFLAHAIESVVLHRPRVGTGIALGKDDVLHAGVGRLVDVRAGLRGVPVLLRARERGGLDCADPAHFPATFRFHSSQGRDSVPSIAAAARRASSASR